MPEIKRITPREFQERGYLQEANRLFFHPLGLALEVTICRHDGRDGSEPHDAADCPIPDGLFSGCWDNRDDPEGILFGEPFTAGERKRAVAVEREREAKVNARRKLGCWPSDGVQPLGWEPPA